MKRLARLTIALMTVFILLVWGARAVGQGLPRSAMLAYVSGNNETLGVVNLAILDWRTRQPLNLGALTGFSGATFTWSADGRLAFVSYRDGNGEIYVWDGNTLTNISRSVFNDRSPAW